MSSEQLDLDGNGNGYSGTFRWKASKVLNSMPSPISGERINLSYSGGWMEYFLSRSKDDRECASLIKQVQGDLSMIDCLSTPISIAYMCSETGLLHVREDNPLPLLNVVCIGCADKAEERILLETNCFNELKLGLNGVALVELWLVGPEISVSRSVPSIIEGMSTNLYRGTAIQFFRNHPQLLGGSTIVVGLNCGFGNFENPLPKRYNLLLSWLPDINFLTATKLPLFFTCANDYADLIGEVNIMQNICGANFISLPQENPFSFASTLVQDTAASKRRAQSGEAKDFSRGNSFWYAVQGHDKSRRAKLSPGGDLLSQFLRVLSSKRAVGCEELLVDPIPIRSPDGPTMSMNQGVSSLLERVEKMNVSRTSPEGGLSSDKSFTASATATATPATVDASTVSTVSTDSTSELLNIDAEDLPSSPAAAVATIATSGGSLAWVDVCASSVSPLSVQQSVQPVEPVEPVVVKQKVNADKNTLVVTIQFSKEVLCNSMSDLGLQVGSSGQTILLEYKTEGSSQLQARTLTLTAAVDVASGSAKFSSAKRKLTYSAIINQL